MLTQLRFDLGTLSHSWIKRPLRRFETGAESSLLNMLRPWTSLTHQFWNRPLRWHKDREVLSKVWKQSLDCWLAWPCNCFSHLFVKSRSFRIFASCPTDTYTKPTCVHWCFRCLLFNLLHGMYHVLTMSSDNRKHSKVALYFVLIITTHYYYPALLVLYAKGQM